MYPCWEIPILLRVPAPAGGGNNKKIFELGNTKSNWERSGTENEKEANF